MENSKISWQADLFDKPQPVFEGIPVWLKKTAQRIWNLHDEFGPRIVENDQYLIYQYWMSEGLGDALGSEQAVQGFYEWFVGIGVTSSSKMVTPPETIRRARQWLTSEQGFIQVSQDVVNARNRKQEMVKNQVRA